ncbi:co-chaperonin GroES [Bacillus phage SP-15]|uniref:Co-chaperonin GroES n=1 Tax=Bacillus phage SP-15 TaxID=1792032 RepID=A0A127AX31_9CAUD|nr:co-chaperonin GroES [Bacillus phage SP-15]AMM44814.1 co-chaperonin GroES [Bacillus phage SP-15]
MNHKIQPTGQNVIIEILKEEEKLGSIILPPPQKGQRDFFQARVIASGKGTYIGNKFVPNDVKEGDIVLVPRLAIKKMKVSGEDKLISYTRNIDIEAIVE